METDTIPLNDTWDNGYIINGKNCRGRFIIRAFNEGGFDNTEVDLQDVIDWVKENKPEMLK